MIVKIEVYNSAGEKIKLIGETPISANLGQVKIYSKGVEADVFNPADGSLKISLDNIQTPDQLGGDYIADFYWNGSNDGGQIIDPGLYYINLSVQNSFGQMETVVKEITVLSTQQYVVLKIYNSAGEVVRKIESANAPGGTASLGVSDIVVVGKNSSDIQITYAPGQIIEWDGKNSDGRTVDSGVYEMEVEIATADGYKMVATKSVTVLNAGNGGAIYDEKVYPNPVEMTSGEIKDVTIAWTPTGTGRITIRIYEMTGGLVRHYETSLVPSSIKWDLMTESGLPVTSGLYIIVLQAKKDTGETQTKIMKMFVIKKG
jgi:flagellar hook assembly protein FlgD